MSPTKRAVAVKQRGDDRREEVVYPSEDVAQPEQEHPRPSSQVVTLGSHVVLEDIAEKTQEGYVLVSSPESDPAAGRLSDESPVGRAICGHRRGEIVKVHAPRRVRHLRIAELRSAPRVS